MKRIVRHKQYKITAALLACIIFAYTCTGYAKNRNMKIQASNTNKTKAFEQLEKEHKYHQAHIRKKKKNKRF